jgi:putative endonuclease
MKAKDILGKQGEELASEYLVEHGYRILERNWRCRQGEIDVVAEREGVTVFVEVKTRSGLRYGHPFEAITIAKMARLRRLASAWCEAAETRRRQIRIDAIGVLVPPREPVTIEHLEGIF